MNILDATETFMDRGDQLGDPSLIQMFNQYGTAEQIDQLRSLRVGLLNEEVGEYLEAENNDDIVEMVDGLLDIIVVAWGTLLAYVGPKGAKAAAGEIVRSNLSKVIGPGLPIKNDAGKIQKPPSYCPPDIAAALGLG